MAAPVRHRSGWSDWIHRRLSLSTWQSGDDSEDVSSSSPQTTVGASRTKNSDWFDDKEQNDGTVVGDDDNSMQQEKAESKWVVAYPGGVNVRKEPKGSAELTGQFLQVGSVIDGFLDLEEDGDDVYTQLTNKQGWVPIQKGTIVVLKTYDPDEHEALEEAKKFVEGRRGSSMGGITKKSASPVRKGSMMDELRRRSTVSPASEPRRGSSLGGLLSRKSSTGRAVLRKGSTLGNITASRKSSAAAGDFQGRVGSGYIDLARAKLAKDAATAAAAGGVSDEDLAAIAAQLRAEMLELTAKQDAEARTRLLRLEQDEERLRKARERDRDAELKHISERVVAAKMAMEEAQQTSLAKVGESEAAALAAVAGIEAQLRHAAEVAELRVQGAAEQRLKMATSVLEKEVREAKAREATALRELVLAREREEEEHRLRLESEARAKVETDRLRGDLIAVHFPLPPELLGFVFFEPSASTSGEGKDKDGVTGQSSHTATAGPFHILAVPEDVARAQIEADAKAEEEAKAKAKAHAEAKAKADAQAQTRPAGSRLNAVFNTIKASKAMLLNSSATFTIPAQAESSLAVFSVNNLPAGVVVVGGGGGGWGGGRVAFDMRTGDAVEGFLEQPLLGRGFRVALRDPAQFPATLLVRRDPRAARRLRLLQHLELRAEERRQAKAQEQLLALAAAKEISRLEQEALAAARERHRIASEARRGEKALRAHVRAGMWSEDPLNSASLVGEPWRCSVELSKMAIFDPQVLVRPERARLAECAEMGCEDEHSAQFRAERLQRTLRRRQRDADRRLRMEEERARRPELFAARGLTAGAGLTDHAFAMLSSHALGMLADRLLQRGLFCEAKAALARGVQVVEANSPMPAPHADLAVVFAAPPLGLEFQRGVAVPGTGPGGADRVPPLVCRVVPGGTAALAGVVAGCEVLAVEPQGGAAVAVAGYEQLMNLLLGGRYPLTVVFRPPGGERQVVFDAPPLGMALMECGNALPRAHHLVPGGRAALLGVKEGWELTALGGGPEGRAPQAVFSFEHALSLLERAQFPLLAVFRAPPDDRGDGLGLVGSAWGNGWLADLYDGDDDDLYAFGAGGAGGGAVWDEQESRRAMNPVWLEWARDARRAGIGAGAATDQGRGRGGRKPRPPSEAEAPAELRRLSASLAMGRSVGEVRPSPWLLLALALDGWAAVCGERELWTQQAEALGRRLALLGSETGPETGFGTRTEAGTELVAEQSAGFDTAAGTGRAVSVLAELGAQELEQAKVLAKAQAKAQAQAQAQAQADAKSKVKHQAKAHAQAQALARALAIADAATNGQGGLAPELNAAATASTSTADSVPVPIPVPVPAAVVSEPVAGSGTTSESGPETEAEILVVAELAADPVKKDRTRRIPSPPARESDVPLETGQRLPSRPVEGAPSAAALSPKKRALVQSRTRRTVVN